MNGLSKQWRLLLLCGLIWLPGAGEAQVTGDSISSKGVAFWCAFMENLNLGFNDAPEFAFQIQAEHNVSGTILLVATGLSIPFTVTAGNITTVNLPPAVYYPQGSESVTNYGFLITASDSIEVKALHWRLYFSESTAVLPVAELGNHYLAECYRFSGDDQSAFVIVATEDNTAVTITPSAVTLNARPPGLPFTVQMNRGQTYQVQSFQDLAGTEIRSPEGKPVAVFGGAKTSQVQCTSANSHLYDQCLPLDRRWFWGYRFFMVPFFGQQSSVLRVLASEDSTQVVLGCDQPVTLQKGETISRVFGAPDVIYADKPVALLQLSRGVVCSGPTQTGDPMLLNLLPEGVYARKAAVKVPLRTSNSFFFAINTLTVIAKKGQSNNIRMNGVPISNYPHPLLGDHWEFTRIAVLPDSTYRLESDVTSFQAYLHGMDFANAYAHWVGFDRIELDTIIGDITLHAPDSVCVDSVFSISVQGGDVQWVDLNFDSLRRVLPDAQLTLGHTGTAFFTASVQTPGFCQPQLVSAKTIVTQCAPPPDTCSLRIPNVFSANNDQLNDVFGPLKAECSFTEYQFTIYNRWGQAVFTSQQPYEAWDGKTGGDHAPSDVYVWRLIYRRYADADLISLKGGVTLLR